MARENTSLSLEELDNDDETVGTQNTVIESGNGTKDPEDLKQALENPLEEPEEEEEEADPADPENTDPEEEEEAPEEEGKPEDEEEEEDENQAAETQTFFEELSTEIGFNVNDLEVDYEGQDPLTPKGISKLIEAVRDNEVNKFDAYIRETYPDAYEHFLILQNGQSTEDYLKNRGEGISYIPSETEVSESVELQKELVTKDLIARGITNKSILSATIKQLEENDELSDEALAVRSIQTKEREDRLAEAEEKAANKIKEEKAINDGISNELNKILNTGQVAKGVVIPKAERAEAVNSFKGNLRIENGKIFHVTEVDPKDIPSAFGKSYLGKKGSIDNLIETKAKTVNATRLRLAAKEESARASGKSQQNRKGGKGNVTLGEMEE